MAVAMRQLDYKGSEPLKSCLSGVFSSAAMQQFFCALLIHFLRIGSGTKKSAPTIGTLLGCWLTFELLF